MVGAWGCGKGTGRAPVPRLMNVVSSPRPFLFVLFFLSFFFSLFLSFFFSLFFLSFFFSPVFPFVKFFHPAPVSVVFSPPPPPLSVGFLFGFFSPFSFFSPFRFFLSSPFSLYFFKFPFFAGGGGGHVPPMPPPPPPRLRPMDGLNRNSLSSRTAQCMQSVQAGVALILHFVRVRTFPMQCITICVHYYNACIVHASYGCAKIARGL